MLLFICKLVCIRYHRKNIFWNINFTKLFPQNKQLYYAHVTNRNIHQCRYIFLTECRTKHVMLDYNTTVIHCHVNCLTRTGWRSTPYISYHFTLSKNLYSADEGTSPLKKKLLQLIMNYLIFLCRRTGVRSTS